VEIHRDLGRHDAEIDALKESIDELKIEVKRISATLSEARGGWRTLMLVGGAASVLGAAISKFFAYLGFH
jgi:putative NADH-flavin reductase